MKLALPFFFDKYGRWDDGFYVTHKTALWEDFLQLCVERISHSLVAKWMPSEGSKLDKKTNGFKQLCSKLKWTPKRLRKHYSQKRSGLVETKLMQKKCHTIRYNTVPGQAMLKYSGSKVGHLGTFMRNDKDRFTTWKNSTEKKVNTKTLHPIEIIRKYLGLNQVDQLLEDMWKQFEVPDVKDSIVLADVSGSMQSPDMKPISACLSLALLTAPHCAFPNQVLTFHSQPSLHQIKGHTLCERIRNLLSAEWGGNTNIQRA